MEEAHSVNEFDQTLELSEYLDGELAPERARGLEARLQASPELARLLEELRAVRDRGRHMGPIEPPRDLWPALEARLGGRVPGGLTLQTGAGRRTFRFSVPQLAAASLVLALLSGGGGMMLARRAPSAPEAVAAAGAGPAAVPVRVSIPIPDAEPLSRELARLEEELEARRGRMDERTRVTVDRSLGVIERAIRESIAALEADPGNEYVEDHLRAALDRKRDLLVRTLELSRAVS